MNMAQSFAPARALARHCEELTSRGPRPEDRSEYLTAWCRDMARALSENLGGLFSGVRLAVKLGDPELLTGQEVFGRIGPVAANTLLRCGGADQTVLLTFDFATAVALTDKSFGGAGEKPETKVEELPRSACLLVDQLAGIFAQTIAQLAAGGDRAIAHGDVIMRSESAARLKAFEPATPCTAIIIDIAAEDGPNWKCLLAIPTKQLDDLMPGLGAGSSGSPPGSDAESDDTNRAVFGSIPLALEAVLAEFDLTLGRLDRLAPGDQIPIAVPREIPLRTGAKLLGHGSVGALEDRIAIRITRINQGVLNQ